MTKILEKQTLNSKWGYSNVPLHQILANLEKFSFWDQICPKNTLGGVLGQTQPENNLF